MSLRFLKTKLSFPSDVGKILALGGDNTAVAANLSNLVQAQNGLSVSAGKVVLGNNIGDNSASLLADRELPLNGFNFVLTGSGRFVIPDTTQNAGGIYFGSPSNSRLYFHNYNGDSNVFVGDQSGNRSLTGTLLTAVGQATLSRVTTAHSCTAVGQAAGAYITTGIGNDLFGTACGLRLTTGNDNTLVGRICGFRLLTGSSNAALGSAAFYNAKNSNFNTAIGFNSQRGDDATPDNGGWNRNTSVGAYALLRVQNGSFANTTVGYSAGSLLTTGVENIFIGNEANLVNINTQVNNAGAIGNRATVTQNNVISIGGVSGINGATATQTVVFGSNTMNHQCAQVEIVSTSRGFLPPRMTTSQRDAIVNPVEGLVIFNTTQKKLNVYNGSNWETVQSV